MNYKNECLKINKDLKCVKVRGTAFFHIITGQEITCHRVFSDYKDTSSQAWKDCYERLYLK